MEGKGEEGEGAIFTQRFSGLVLGGYHFSFSFSRLLSSNEQNIANCHVLTAFLKPTSWLSPLALSRPGTAVVVPLPGWPHQARTDPCETPRRQGVERIQRRRSHTNYRGRPRVYSRPDFGKGLRRVQVGGDSTTSSSARYPVCRPNLFKASS